MFNLELKKNDKEIINSFKSAETFKDLANFFEITPSFLRSTIYAQKKYKTFFIKKKRYLVNQEQRKLLTPTKNLKILQKKLTYALNLLYKPSPFAHGFVKNKSILTNAKVHLESNTLLNFDIKNFFESIDQKKVYGVFKYYFNKNKLVSGVLTELCTYEGVLPTGAPTSPILSNIICYRLDKKLSELCIKNRCKYSRYVDDISISTKKNFFNNEIVNMISGEYKLGNNILDLLCLFGFEVNESKTRIQTWTQRQVVTGIKVNKKLNIDRNYILNLRAMLHNFKTLDSKEANARFFKHYKNRDRLYNKEIEPLEVIRGMINYVTQVKGKNDLVSAKLIKQFNEIDKPDHISDIQRYSKEQLKYNHSVFKIEIEAYSYSEKIENGLEETSQYQYEMLTNRLQDDFIMTKKEVEKPRKFSGESSDNIKYINIKDGYNEIDMDFISGREGTGFYLEDIGIITCTHLLKDIINLNDKNNLFNYRIVAKAFNPNTETLDFEKELEIVKFNRISDIAVLTFVERDDILIEKFRKSETPINKGDSVKLLGYPVYQTNSSFIENKTSIIGFRTEKKSSSFYNKKSDELEDSINQYIINATVYEGNSGGPLLNNQNQVIGLAVRGTTSNKIDGNIVTPIYYLDNLSASDEKKITLIKDYI